MTHEFVLFQLSQLQCVRYAALLLHLNTECYSFVAMEDDSNAHPILIDHTPFATAFHNSEISLMSKGAPYVKLFSTSRFYRFGIYDPQSYFILGSIGVTLAIVLNAVLGQLEKYSTKKMYATSVISIAVGVMCGVLISRPILFPLPHGVFERPDECCSQAHLYAGGNSSITRNVAQALLDAVDRVEMYDISLADMPNFGKVDTLQLVHRPSLFGHVGVSSSMPNTNTRTNFQEHIED